ncbi:MAG TPA: tRNA dimethylallyltransferase, partial [Bacteroidales bacterium]|nr:tRNA dimethylallyltransferase [Bacteroidales bacterium]
KYVRMYKEEGIMGLRVALKMLDPDHYSRVDLKNHMRIIRALEISESTGQPYSSFLRKEKPCRDFKVLKIGLQRDRQELFDRINRRVDRMIIDGLEEEAVRLYSKRKLNSLNTVGYREFFDFFDGKTDREEAIRLIKRNTRRYAKRQLTWWARDNSITWFSAEDEKGVFGFIEEVIGNR